MIPYKSSLFNKIPTFLVENKNKIPTFSVENKNKIPTFLVKNKNFSQNFVIAFEKMPGSGLQKNSRLRIRKKTNPDPQHWWNSWRMEGFQWTVPLCYHKTHPGLGLMEADLHRHLLTLLL